MITLHHGDALAVLRTVPAETVQTCITSPPYWGLRDYGVVEQLGLERTPEEYVARLVEIFREVKRTLKADGTLWLNLGDSYAGSWGAQGKDANPGLSVSGAISARQVAAAARKASGTGTIAAGSGLKPKDLVGIPWMVAFALRADGWWLRSEIIWHKRNPMPSSIKDRPTTSHEQIFLLAKSPRYYYDADAIKEPAARPEGPGNTKAVRLPGERKWANGNIRGGLHLIGPRPDRAKRTVWTIAAQPYRGAHFATYPPKLIQPCVLAGSRTGDVVLDPFNGAGTTGLVATRLRRHYIGIDVNHEYLTLTRQRLAEVQQELFTEGGQ
ncbi:MAG: site-specific DNA-methyltransferase [Pseudomonadota bacterium]